MTERITAAEFRALQNGNTPRGRQKPVDKRREGAGGCDVHSGSIAGCVGASEARLTLPYPPATNNLYATVRGRRVKTERCRRFHAAVLEIATRAGIARREGSVALRVDIYRPRRTGDLDNTLKVIQDSLTGLAWVDDSQVIEIHAYRFEDKANPRAEVTIGEVE